MVLRRHDSVHNETLSDTWQPHWVDAYAPTDERGLSLVANLGSFSSKLGVGVEGSGSRGRIPKLEILNFQRYLDA